MPNGEVHPEREMGLGRAHRMKLITGRAIHHTVRSPKDACARSSAANDDNTPSSCAAHGVREYGGGVWAHRQTL